jgi:hypothetical protein
VPPNQLFLPPQGGTPHTSETSAIMHVPEANVRTPYVVWHQRFYHLKPLHLNNHELTVLVEEKYYTFIHTHASIALAITESVQ